MYYIPDRRHPTLTKLLQKHLNIGSACITDNMSTYVRPKSETSRLEQYGFYHFFYDLSTQQLHEKFSWI
jgi:hypothetical protein